MARIVLAALVLGLYSMMALLRSAVLLKAPKSPAADGGAGISQEPQARAAPITLAARFSPRVPWAFLVSAIQK